VFNQDQHGMAADAGGMDPGMRGGDQFGGGGGLVAAVGPEGMQGGAVPMPSAPAPPPVMDHTYDGGGLMPAVGGPPLPVFGMAAVTVPGPPPSPSVGGLASQMGAAKLGSSNSLASNSSYGSTSSLSSLGGGSPEKEGGAPAELPKRRRGRPKKDAQMDDEERRQRRIISNRQAARRAYYRRVERTQVMQQENLELRNRVTAAEEKVQKLEGAMRQMGLGPFMLPDGTVRSLDEIGVVVNR